MCQPNSGTIAFDPNIALAPSIPLASFPLAATPRVAALRSVLANAVLAHWLGSSVHYPRDNNAFTDLDAPDWYSRSVIVGVVDQLCEEGFLEGLRTFPSPKATYRSRFWVNSKLERLMRDLTLDDLALSQRQNVVVRKRRSRTPIKVQHQAPETRALAKDIQAQNDILRQTSVDLRKGRYPRDRGVILAGNRLVLPIQKALQRIFVEDLHLGGRWYGGWWQNVPKLVRKDILIDDMPTVEADFAACQLRLMYGMLGLRDPLRGAVRDPGMDLFSRAGEDRDAVKLAVLIGINATTERSALGALAKKLREEGLSVSGSSWAEARRIFTLVQKHFPELSPLWFTDAGLRLQRIDSDMCAHVQRTMRDQGIPILSVHDSFLCVTVHHAKLISAMEEAISIGMRQASERGSLVVF